MFWIFTIRVFFTHENVKKKKVMGLSTFQQTEKEPSIKLTSKHARALLRVEQLNDHNCPSGTSGGDEREGQIMRTFYDDVVSTER
jgi:hypothetical protein